MIAVIRTAALLSVLLFAACAQKPLSPDSSKTAVTAEDPKARAARQAFFVNDVRQGRCDKIAPALESGLTVNGFDTLDQTPLIAAVSQNQLDCARQLVERGADTKLADNAGWTPLIHAAYFGGSLELLTLLLDHGADINAQNGRGLTALYLASASGHEPQVAFLLARGADTQLASESGYTPVRVAQLRGLSRIVELLQTGAAPTAVSTH